MRDESLSCKERLLAEDDTSDHYQPRSRSRTSYPVLALSFLVLVLLISNVYFLKKDVELHRAKYSAVSKFTSLAQDAPQAYHFRTEWWGDNDTLADELWDNLDISPVAVALSDEWASQHGVKISESRFPWDDAKGLYFVKVFHQLHCLKLLRKAFVDLDRGNPPIIRSKHIYHCLDTLRQDVTCKADDTPMPTINQEGMLGENQVRMCRDMDRLIAWTQDSERNACYRRLSDYKWPYHKIERYAFCPEDSPYRPVAEAYFAKWGHHDPFEP